MRDLITDHTVSHLVATAPEYIVEDDLGWLDDCIYAVAAIGIGINTAGIHSKIITADQALFNATMHGCLCLTSAPMAQI